MAELIYKKEVYAIIGAAMETHLFHLAVYAKFHPNIRLEISNG